RASLKLKIVNSSFCSTFLTCCMFDQDVAEYRALADECGQRARSAASPLDQKAWAILAAEWTRLACFGPMPQAPIHCFRTSHRREGKLPRVADRQPHGARRIAS